MSNNTNSVAVPETETPVEEKPQVKQPKNVAARIFAFLFAAIAVAALFLPYSYVLVDGAPVKTSFFSAILKLFKGGETSKLFGVIPTFADVLLDDVPGTINISGIITSFVFYLFLLLNALCVIFGIITVFTSKKAPGMLRATVFCFLYAYSMYALWNVGHVVAQDKKFLIDIVTFAGTGVGLITYLVLALKRKGAGALVSFVQFLLSLTVSCLLIFAFEANTDAFKDGLAKFGIKAFEIVLLVAVALCALNIMCAYIRIQVKKGLPFDCIRYVLQLLIAGVAAYIEIANKQESKLFMILTIVAAGVSLFQIILCIIQAVAGKKKAKKVAEAEEQPVEPVQEEVKEEEAPVQEYVAEEHVEPVAYEGGPVEGVETAELVEEEPAVEEKPVAEKPAEETQTAGYDFYNTKSFDPFIATLNDKERNDFTDLFILRCKGDMPEIPEYVVGEPKKDFFRKIFVYLGKYRDMIPDELLMKIYQFSFKLK